MSRLQTQGFRFVVCAVSAAVCLALFLLILPDFEETRTEARMGHAYREVHELADSIDLDPDSPILDMTSVVDPWGQPYHITKTDGRILVICSGPNMSTPTNGLDNDDVHSDMDHSPTEALHAAKRRRLIFALSIPVIWLICSIIYLRSGVPQVTTDNNCNTEA